MSVDQREMDEPVKPHVAVLYQLARTGGTIMSKCLGCIEGNVLLSEVHPVLSVVDPLKQAVWFELVSEAERATLLAEPSPSDLHRYLDAISLINERVCKLGKKLILRDWSHIDFMARPMVNRPSYEMLQAQLLRTRFAVREYATVRHPLRSFQSMNRLAIMKGNTLAEYMRDFRQFAEKAVKLGFVRYEDFCEKPQPAIEQIARALEVDYHPNFVDRFREYTQITGDTERGQGATSIEPPPRRPIDQQLEQAALANADYRVILELLGYEHSP